MKGDDVEKLVAIRGENFMPRPQNRSLVPVNDSF